MSQGIPLEDFISHEELLEQLSEGVYVVDGSRRIHFWNRGAERLSGYSRAEVQGRSCADNVLIHVDDTGLNLCQHKCPVADTLQDGNCRESRVYLHHKQGHRVPVFVRTAPVRDRDGRVIGAIETFTDATPRNDMEARLTELERLAMMDQLTEIPNRRMLEVALSARVDEYARYRWPFGVLLIDIDRFKALNDTHGHLVGDKALKMVAKTLANAARTSDLVGRWGGEEFVAVVARTDMATLEVVAERLRALVASAVLDEAGESIRVTVSIGGAVVDVADSGPEILGRADERLYEAKQSGRNRVCC